MVKNDKKDCLESISEEERKKRANKFVWKKGDVKVEFADPDTWARLMKEKRIKEEAFRLPESAQKPSQTKKPNQD